MPDKSKITSAHRMAELSSLVAALKEQEVLEAIEADLRSGAASPIEILHACQKGMRMVGAMHEEGRYFIAGLIMAGEIMRQAIELLKPVLIKAGIGKNTGRVLLGTIEGDIHDIGKNLFRDLLECHGFSVMDLGVDVPPAISSRRRPSFDLAWWRPRHWSRKVSTTFENWSRCLIKRSTSVRKDGLLS
ncbi:MAG: cobalamin B12-binding domain-containing protein [Syntrophobacteraceae bacterium]